MSKAALYASLSVSAYQSAESEDTELLWYPDCLPIENMDTSEFIETLGLQAKIYLAWRWALGLKTEDKKVQDFIAAHREGWEKHMKEVTERIDREDLNHFWVAALGVSGSSLLWHT